MTTPNLLGSQRVPRFFAVDAAAEGLTPPPVRRPSSMRTYGRSLAGMQKEAVVVSAASNLAWRLVSDEGPYLDGHDEAPFPLAFLSAGMAASYTNELVALAAQRGVALDELVVTVDNRYTMNGSALRGTMTGGALAPEVRVTTSTPASTRLRALAADALDASPLNGMLRARHDSRFTLSLDGRALVPDRVEALDAEVVGPHAADATPRPVGAEPDEPLVRRVTAAEQRQGVEGGKGSSLQAEQQRTLHVEARCTLGADEVKTIDVALHSPLGSSFRFRSEEARGSHDPGAPDAATLVSAGIAFCFMTQFGRYAAITRERLGGYAVIQDLHLSAGGASGHTGRAGEADPVETHVHLQGTDEAFARRLVDMGEQTCFLHALCRTALKPRLMIGSVPVTAETDRSAV